MNSNKSAKRNFRLDIILFTTVYLFGYVIYTSAQTGYLYLIDKSPCEGTVEEYGYVDENGKIVIPIGKYPLCYTDTIRTIGFVFSMEESRIIAIDKSDKKIFTVYNFDNGPDYVEEGLFRIVNDSTSCIGFADMDGKIIIQPRFFYVDYFSGGFAAFNVGGKQEPVDEEHTAIAGGKWGYIDKTGKEIFPAIFDKAFPFDEGKAEVQIGEYNFCLLYK